MMSVTSSLPQVSLTPQKLSDPTGHGLSGFGPGTVATWPGGNALSSSCLKNGNGSELSLVRLRYTPRRQVAALPEPGAAPTMSGMANPSCTCR